MNFKEWGYPPPSAPTLTSNATTGISTTSARFNGYLSNAGGVTTTVGFWYGTSSPPRTKYVNGTCTAPKVFYHTQSGLIQRTKYFVRAYGNNSAGITNGSILSFYTPATWLTKQSGYDTFRNTASWVIKTSGYDTFRNTASWVAKASGYDTFQNIASWVLRQQGYDTFQNTVSWVAKTSGYNTFQNASSWVLRQQGYNTFQNASSWVLRQQGYDTFGNTALWKTKGQGWSTFTNLSVWSTKGDGWNTFFNISSWGAVEQGWSSFANTPSWVTDQSGWDTFGNTSASITIEQGWDTFGNSSSYRISGQGWNTFGSTTGWHAVSHGWSRFGNISVWGTTAAGWSTFHNLSFMAVLDIFPSNGSLVCPTCYENDTFFYFNVHVDHTNGSLMDITWTTWNGTVIGAADNVGNGTYHIVPIETIYPMNYSSVFNYTITVTDGVTTIVHNIFFSTNTQSLCEQLLGGGFSDKEFAVALIIVCFTLFFVAGYRSKKRSGGAFMLLSGFFLMSLAGVITILYAQVFIVPFAVFICIIGIRKWLFRPDKEKTKTEGQ